MKKTILNYLIITLVVIFVSSTIMSPLASSEESIEVNIQSSENMDQNYSKKIHPTIAEWQSSTEPETYALSRSLSFSDNKIAVYIHLDSKESISNLPNDVEVLSSDENIVLAFLSSSQIDQLSQLDFVERIAPPPITRNPPIPSQLEDNTTSMTLTITIAVVVAITVAIFAIARTRRKKMV